MNIEGHPEQESALMRLNAAMSDAVFRDPQITRRAFLGISALTLLDVGVLALRLRQGSLEKVIGHEVSLPTDGLCSDDIGCNPDGDILLSYDIPDVQVAPDVVESLPTEPVVVVAEPEPPQEVLAPSPKPIESPRPIEAPSAELEPAPSRAMSFEELEANHEELIARLPRLEQLAQLFPNSTMYQRIAEQKQHIDMLAEQIVLSADEYRAFTLNTEFQGIFQGLPEFSMRAVVHHWTGAPVDYDSVPHFAQSMAGRASVQLYAHKDDEVYLLTPTLYRQAGHARSLNPHTLGIEYYSGPYNGHDCPIFSYTPTRSKRTIYATVQALLGANRPANSGTILGHYGADMILRNPYYDPYTGEMKPIEGYKAPHIRKQDPPQEYIDMVVGKSIELYNLLG